MNRQTWAALVCVPLLACGGGGGTEAALSAAPAPAPAPAPTAVAPAKSTAPDRIESTEKVRADSEVSFPVDI